MLFQSYQSYQQSQHRGGPIAIAGPGGSNAYEQSYLPMLVTADFHVCLFVWLKTVGKKNGPAGLTPGAVLYLAGVEGLEPPAPGFGDRCSTN